MTLPALTANYKKLVVVTRLKKFESTIGNALTLSVAQNGDMTYWDFPAEQNNGQQMDAFVDKYIFPYLTGMSKCYSNERNTSCVWANQTKLQQYPEQPLYEFMDGGCFSLTKGGGTMMHILYDVNCRDNPNEYNKDTFSYVVYYIAGKSFTLEAGSTSTYGIRNRNELLRLCKNEDNSPHNRGACTALIRLDGWEIRNDYPYKL